LEEYIQKLKPDTIFLNKGVNSDSQLKTLIPEDDLLKKISESSKIDESFMHNILA
jgi:hypothetical protein